MGARRGRQPVLRAAGRGLLEQPAEGVGARGGGSLGGLGGAAGGEAAAGRSERRDCALVSGLAGGAVPTTAGGHCGGGGGAGEEGRGAAALLLARGLPLVRPAGSGAAGTPRRPRSGRIPALVAVWRDDDAHTGRRGESAARLHAARSADE